MPKMQQPQNPIRIGYNHRTYVTATYQS
uniref:Uncharacterized protein n=1 Tax=Rhizophora mucronata TaxID=61149 RepID=A0A2P2PT80_RHIMU